MIEFNEAAEKAGADMMRWVYARQRIDDNLNFGYDYLATVRKDFFIPLWNCYSFFVTYANIDGWTPGTIGDSQRTALDHWILARLAEVVQSTHACLAEFNSRDAALALEAFTADLSNWYVRRSRERFWSSGMSADKRAAYETMYEVLTALCKLLAPFVPFTAEAIWQNLTNSEFGARSVELAAAKRQFSVHHQTLPVARVLSSEEQALLTEVATARTTVNLGHSLRAQSKIKVRQPLSKLVVVGNAAQREAITRQQDVIASELNVKQVQFAPREEDLVTYKVLPDLKKLGRKLGANMPAVRDALAATAPGEIAARVKAGLPVTVAGVELAADEVLVQAQPKDGLLVEGANGIVAALDTQLTEPLLQEGLAREVVRRVNDLRKASGLQLSDRVHLTYRASDRLAAAIRAHETFVGDETLATKIVAGEPTGHTANDAFDGETLAIGIVRA
jgi:isoleucyl-tRNA synthetase